MQKQERKVEPFAFAPVAKKPVEEKIPEKPQVSDLIGDIERATKRKQRVALICWCGSWTCGVARANTEAHQEVSEDDPRNTGEEPSGGWKEVDA